MFGSEVGLKQFLYRFDDLESIIATRLSLVQSVRNKEQREQIGTMLSSFSCSLLDLEKNCLVQLAAAAQNSNQVQAALNATVRAQQLEKTPSFAVSQQFANVLWLQQERKLASEFLRSEMQRDGRIGALSQSVTENLQNAVNLARLVSSFEPFNVFKNPTVYNRANG